MRSVVLIIVCFLVSQVSYTQQCSNDKLFDKIDLSLPPLSSVKNYIDKGQFDKAERELLDHFRSKQNIYLNISKKDVPFLKSHYKSDVEKSIKTADEVLNKYFLFRYDWDMEKTNIPHQFEGEIDWMAMPNGDEEWCFMLNRHRYWIDLGKAYMLTKDEKYALAFVEQVSHWIDNNPFEEKYRYYTWRRIGAGIRCENWIKAFEYFKQSKSITPQFFSKFITSLYQHGQYLNSSYSSFSKTSNWGVIEFNGLYTLTHFLSEFKQSKEWQNNAVSCLNNCIDLQIMEDGTQWEQSPMYHNEVFHCYMNIIFLAQQQMLELPALIIEKTKAMAYANVQWQKPNYHQPLLGDSDDTDTRGILTTAAFLFFDPVLKSRAYRDFDYDNVFLFGKDELTSYKNMEIQNPAFESIYQTSSGDFYMRSSWKEEASYASLHMKKLGCGHGHDNLLHFSLFANGRDYLIDGGRYTYVDNEWRELFKCNISHNTLGVDQLPNSIYANSWQNYYGARSEGIYSKIDDVFDYAEATNTAYKRLDDPVIMKRRLLFLKNANVWLLFDSFSANKTHIYSQYFNFPNKKVSVKNSALITTYEEDNLKVQAIKNVEIKLSDAWWSPEYNLKEETLRAELSREATGFDSFITLLNFPEEQTVSYKRVPVYNRNRHLFSDKETEAVTISFKDKEYTIIVRHNITEHFFIVNDQFLSGEVVVLEKKDGGYEKYLIKE